MLIALDHNDRRVHIDDTQSNRQYFCPYCGSPLIMRKGEIRRHHFAHSRQHLCSDSWTRNGGYDMSDWHMNWQNAFPPENQELCLTLGSTRHRADVLIGRTVVEFQNSILSEQHFDDRNNFYLNLGCKVVWMFNLSGLLESGRITRSEDGRDFYWKNPKKAFNCYDLNAGSIDLFFDLGGASESSIVRVTEVSDRGFEAFSTTEPMTKGAFLDYLGVKDGICPPPEPEDLQNDPDYLSFKAQYGIRLDPRQERAMQAVEGAVLLLAVPGSGKTTVLVDRLGFMVLQKGIDPGSILAITFTNSAAEEMKQRFSQKFGWELGQKIRFSTINALARGIYRDFCAERQHPTRSIIPTGERRALFRALHGELFGDPRPSEAAFLQFVSAVTYAKNRMRTEDADLREFDALSPQFSRLFPRYEAALKQRGQMDFDDQLIWAHWILTHQPDVLADLRKQYRYLCVDEAQDTSMLQHAIIRLLAKGGNLFMVGDEDQSIYGFRGAYPRALLNFRYEYNNPYILRMETNYRSTPQIVEKAQSFIAKNRGRYEKHMTSARPEGVPVALLPAADRADQYRQVLETAKNAVQSTAFLYRENASAVVPVDLFLRNGISFRMKKPEQNFFRHRAVRELTAYLGLALDHREEQLPAGLRQHTPAELRRIAGSIACLSPEKAIRTLLDSRTCAAGADAELLLLLARQEQDIPAYLSRLHFLEQQMQKDFDPGGAAVTLSTVHSSKGQEYDRVYLLDLFDGYFPSFKPNPLNRSKDSAEGEMEERRLFYVGMTRAREELSVFRLKDKNSSYIEEIFPELRVRREQRALKEAQRSKAQEEERRRQKEEAERLRRQEEDRQHQEERARKQALWAEEQMRQRQAWEHRKPLPKGPQFKRPTPQEKPWWHD